MDVKVIKVRLVESQWGSSEDIFRGMEDKKFYSRMKNGQWGHSTKWYGGYERAYSIEPGVKIEIYNNKRELLFAEDSHGVSDVNYPFSWDVGKNRNDEIVEKFGLISYDEWKLPLLKKIKEFNYTGNVDNWLHFFQTKIESNVLEIINYYDDVYEVRREIYEHDICKNKWIEYSLFSKTNGLCKMIFGYSYDAN